MVPPRAPSFLARQRRGWLALTARRGLASARGSDLAQESSRRIGRVPRAVVLKHPDPRKFAAL